MALIEEMDKSGNWLFRWRSFLPLLLFFRCGSGRAVFRRFVGTNVCCLRCHLGVAIDLPGCGHGGPEGPGFVRWVHAQGDFWSKHQRGASCRITEHQGHVFGLPPPLVLGQLAHVVGHCHVHGPLVGSPLLSCSCMHFTMSASCLQRSIFCGGNLASPIWIGHRMSLHFGQHLAGGSLPRFASPCGNVLKREYNGFFAMFLSFAWVDGLHGFREADMEASFFASPALHLPAFLGLCLGCSFCCVLGSAYPQKDHEGARC